MNRRFSGVLAPVITPFKQNLDLDSNQLAKHCQWLLSQQVGLAIFGTNSEANSLSVEEKIDLLDYLRDAGVDPTRMMPGTGSCALPDAIRLTAHAAKLGCGGTLMLPPFYYKGVSDDGLFAFFAEVIERVGNPDLQIYLYHIPLVSQVGIGIPLIERLLHRYPQTIAGIKDSSGDWATTAALNAQGWDDFRVFCGSEGFLLQNMLAGGAGCISATANVNPAAIHDLYANFQAVDAEQRQAALNEVRAIFQGMPMIPALKAATGHFGKHAEWQRVRPPIVPFSAAQTTKLMEKLSTIGFGMPGL